MKKIVILILCLWSSTYAGAQGFFNQKTSLLRRAAEQVAALKAYKGVLTKGYNIVKDGTRTISDLKNGDLNLHTTFFNGLKGVNPSIRNWNTIPDIVNYQVAIIKLHQSSMQTIKSSNMYDEGELQYVSRVFKTLLDECARAIDELTNLITANRLEMADDQRIKRLQDLHDSMVFRFQFMQGFVRRTLTVGAARIREEKDLNQFKEQIR